MTWCALDTPEFICLVLSGGKPGSTICLLENRNEHAINCSRYCMHASRFEVDFISVSSFVFFFFCEGVSSFVHTAVLKLNVFRLLGCTYVSVDDCMASTRNSIHFHFHFCMVSRRGAEMAQPFSFYRKRKKMKLIKCNSFGYLFHSYFNRECSLPQVSKL